MTRDFYLTKKNSTSRTMFPATELENGMLIGTNRLPMVIGDELKEAGFTASDLSTDVDSLPEALAKIVLRVGDNRGHLVERRETPSERKAREKAERDAQNAFLREKGYRWEQRSFYCSGDIGDFVEYWALIDPDGNEVIGKKDGGGWIKEVGSVKRILTDLGYYGREAIDKAEAEAEARTERRQMREKVDAYFADDANRTGETFEDAQAEFTTRPIQIEKHYPRRQFRIESDCLWLETHNRSDGDDWSLNNCDYGIARQYKFGAEIAEAIKQLSK